MVYAIRKGEARGRRLVRGHFCRKALRELAECQVHLLVYHLAAQKHRGVVSKTRCPGRQDSKPCDPKRRTDRYAFALAWIGDSPIDETVPGVLQSIVFSWTFLALAQFHSADDRE